MSTLSEAARPTSEPRGERREHPRYDIVRSVLAIPLTPEGLPDWQNRLPGFTTDLSVDGIGLELDTDRPLDASALVIGVERRDGVACYAGVEMRYTQRLSPRRLKVGAKLGGRADDILSPDNLAPSIDLPSMRIVRGVQEDVLAAWAEIGVLSPVLLDRIQVCPKCHGIPTFRSGCRSCGSARIAAARLIHHYACAHVGPVNAFESADGLVCPKCRTRRLVIGSDFEYHEGPSQCHDCHWSGTELEQVGQCLRCGFRFPGRQAHALEMIGYHVQRLVPLAFISAP
jgi:hypothetical protein